VQLDRLANITPSLGQEADTRFATVAPASRPILPIVPPHSEVAPSYQLSSTYRSIGATCSASSPTFKASGSRFGEPGLDPMGSF
jgi:hypothetical protein